MLRSLQIAQLFVREPALQRHLGGVLNDKLFAGQDTCACDLSPGGDCDTISAMSTLTSLFLAPTDVQATGNYLPLAAQFAVPVVAGPAAKWVAVLPTLRRIGEGFDLGRVHTITNESDGTVVITQEEPDA